MTTITIDTNDMNSEGLLKTAYAIVDSASYAGRSIGTRRNAIRSVYAIINEIESRATGGDTSELRELVESLERCVFNDSFRGRQIRETNKRITERKLRTYRSKRLGNVTIPE